MEVGCVRYALMMGTVTRTMMNMAMDVGVQKGHAVATATMIAKGNNTSFCTVDTRKTKDNKMCDLEIKTFKWCDHPVLILTLVLLAVALYIFALPLFFHLMSAWDTWLDKIFGKPLL